MIIFNILYPISFHGNSINSCAKAAKPDVTGLMFLETDLETNVSYAIRNIVGKSLCNYGKIRYIIQLTYIIMIKNY